MNKDLEHSTILVTRKAALRASGHLAGVNWMANYTEPEVKSALWLADDISVVAIIALGYADENPEPRPRKPTAEIVEYI